MLKRINRLFCILIIWIIIISPVMGQEIIHEEIVSRIREEGFQRSQVMDMAGTICDVYGFRLTGSEGMKAAQQWVKSKMEEIGLKNTEIEPFMDYGVSWDMEYISVHMVEPDYYPLAAFPLAFTPGTPGKGVHEAVIAEIQNESDFDKFRGKLKDKAVLISPLLEINPEAPIVARRRTEEELANLAQQAVPRQRRRRRGAGGSASVSWKDRLAFFKSEGAAVLIQCPSGRIGAVRTFGRPGANQDGRFREGMMQALPMISMVPEHYNRMFRILERGIPVTLEIEIRNRIGGKTEARNVLGEIPGTDLKDQVVMIGAHFDSWHSSPGASDNICGSVVMLEAMRILKAIGAKPRRTIRIALWSGEEQGLFGSRAYVKDRFGDPETGTKRAYDKFSVYFNMDNGRGRFKGVQMQGNEFARPIFKEWIKPFHDIGLKTLTIRFTGSTDHIPFDRVGLPAFQFLQDRFGIGSGHTNTDFFDTLLEEDLMVNAVVIASFAYHAAMREGLFPRKTKE